MARQPSVINRMNLSSDDEPAVVHGASADPVRGRHFANHDDMELEDESFSDNL